MQTRQTTLESPPSDAPSPLERWATGAFVIGLVGNALSAYRLGPIPIPWIAQCATVAFVIYLVLATQRMLVVPGLQMLAVFGLWAFIVTFTNTSVYGYDRLMPKFATMPYYSYQFLRFLNVVAAGAQIYLTYWLVCRRRQETPIRLIVLIGTLVAAAGIYIYLAQIYDLPEPSRTRMGTGGGEQSTIYSYAFHRATGTFREPSHMAAWLVVPFFLSLLFQRAKQMFPALLIGVAILLTGSMTALVGATAGLTVACLLLNPLNPRVTRVVVRLLLILAVGYGLFLVIAVAYPGGHTSLLQVVRNRLAPIFFEGGMANSNRAYVYSYVRQTPVPLVGHGLGNANLVFSNHLGSPLVCSFLSLYLNVLFSTGLLGLLIMLAFLLRPVVAAWRGHRGSDTKRRLLLLGAYCSWLIMFSVHAEELEMMFATIYAIMCHEAQFPALAGEASFAAPHWIGAETEAGLPNHRFPRKSTRSQRSPIVPDPP